ncbi:MAG: exo-alpha-sialidase [Ruminococcus sp.]|nr:exo-alpha-sialidase [Candidatus Copronaster equi]
MKIHTLDSVKLIMANRNSIHNYFGWPSITRLKNGDIAVASSGFRLEHICPFGKAIMAVSTDEAQTFTPPQVIIDTVLDDRDAGLLPFGESGLIVTSFNNTRAFQRHCNPDNKYILSYLEEISDEQEKEILGSTFRVSFDNGKTFSDIYKCPVSSPHGPIELNDGTILWVGTQFGKKVNDLMCVKVNPTNGECEFIGKIDGKTNTGEEIELQEPYAFQLPDGKLICHIRADDGKIFTLYQSESTDCGKTWTAPKQLISDRGGAPAHIMMHSSGTLISVYGYRERPYGIRVMFSKDGGETWNADNILWADGANDDLGYPATVELEDGNLFTVFYAHLSENQPAEILGIKWNFE